MAFKMICAVIFLLLTASVCLGVCAKTEPLFIIERNKNGNKVHYDACIRSNGNLSDREPVVVYWILENGKREKLNKVERDYAYGITEQKKIGKGTVRIVLVSIKDRPITISRIGGRYKATTSIDKKECVLDKVYVKSHELIVGLPRVEWIELSGTTTNGGIAVKEKMGNP